jgi:hypothetical protein
MRRSAGFGVRRRGSTLIEVFLAATVIAIGFIGVAGSMSYAAKVSRLSRDTVTGENVAAGLLAQARAGGLSSLAAWYTYPGESGVTGLEERCATELGQSGLPKPEAWMTVTDVGSGLKGVTLVIEWGVGTPRGRVSASTLVSARY